MQTNIQRICPEGYDCCSDGLGTGSVYHGMTKSGFYHAIGHKPKSIKPVFNYTFKTESQMNAYIEQFFKGTQQHRAIIEQRRNERKAFKTAIKPGDIIHTSWGYDQTNVEFFQVLTVNNNTITIRELCQNKKETGFMCGDCSPIKDQFINDAPVITKRVQFLKENDPYGYVKFESYRYGWYFAGEKHYYSYYG